MNHVLLITRRPTAQRMALWLAAAAAIFLTAGLLGLDRIIASHAISAEPLDRLVAILELVTLKNVSEFVLPGTLIFGGGAAWVLERKKLALALIYVGFVQLLSYLSSDLSKPLFGRLRPYEVLRMSQPDTWFAHGNSFPSGHVAYFAGIVVPVVILAPRTWPLLMLPLLVAAQRICAGDHYPSDAAASLLLVSIFAFVLSPLLNKNASASVDNPGETAAEE